MRPIALDCSPPCQLRLLTADDSQQLASYFEGLSADTRQRFTPHPLTADYADTLCRLKHDSAQRFILELSDAPHTIIGYFILDHAMGSDEARRYHTLGVELQSELDLLFAPSIADQWQGKGLATAAMPHLVSEAAKKGARSLVLLGGVQDSNSRAKGLYHHFGFKPHSGYQSGTGDDKLWHIDMRLEFAL